MVLVSSYVHELLITADSFRILEVQPSADPTAPIEIKLIVSKLGHYPEYEALSYTWSDPLYAGNEEELVKCSGKSIPVTANCAAALRQFRQSSSCRTLWIDAICIDQTNDEERGQQVSLMRTIYSQAKQVLIWLGTVSREMHPEHEIPLSTFIMQYIEKLVLELPKYENGIVLNEESDSKSSPLYDTLLEDIATYTKDHISTTLLTAFLQFIRRTWWDRVWVLQEVLAQPDALIYCGSESIHHKDVLRFFRFLWQDSRQEAGYAFSLLDSIKHHLITANSFRFAMTRTDRRRSLGRMLPSTRRLKATDIRDHIFSLRGLLIDLGFNELSPYPDYSQSVRHVFTEMSRNLVKVLGPGYVFFNVARADDNDIDNPAPQYPSWCIDWSQRPQLHSLAASGYYNATGHSHPNFKFPTSDPSTLHIQVHPIDRIAYLPKAPLVAYRYPYRSADGIVGYRQSIKVGDELLSLVTNPASVATSALAHTLSQAVLDSLLANSSPPTAASIRDTLWRTLCWDIDVNYQRPASDIYAASFENFRAALLRPDLSIAETEAAILEERDNKTGPNEFNAFAVHSMPVGVLADTAVLASLPSSAREGDIVVLIAGCEVPFVFREIGRVESGEGAGMRVCRLVGPCFVHHLMDGEGWVEGEEGLEWIAVR